MINETTYSPRLYSLILFKMNEYKKRRFKNYVWLFISVFSIIQLTITNANSQTKIIDLNSIASAGDTERNFSATFTQGTEAVAIAHSEASIVATAGDSINALTIDLGNAPTDGENEVLVLSGTKSTTQIALNSKSFATVFIGGNALDITSTGLGKITFSKSGGSALTTTQATNLLRAIKYQNLSATPTTATRSFQVAADDSNIATSSVAVEASRIAPVIDLNSNASTEDVDRNFATTFTQGKEAVSIASAEASIFSNENTALNTLTIDLGITPTDGENEILILNGTRSISKIALNSKASSAASIDGVALTVTSTGLGKVTIQKSDGGALTATQVTSLLRAIKYQNVSATPTAAIRAFKIAVDDSNVATSSISVEANQITPIIDLNSSASKEDIDRDFAATFIIGKEAVAIASAKASISVAESTSINALTIDLGKVPADGEKEMLVLNTGKTVTQITLGRNVKTSATIGEAVLTISSDGLGKVTFQKSGGESLTATQATSLLRAIKYQNLSTTPTRLAREFKVLVADSNIAISSISLGCNTRKTCSYTYKIVYRKKT